MKGLAVALLLGLMAPAVEAAQEHGKTDVFSGHGVKLAWAVARGADEASTFVVIRVAADTAKYRALSVTGRDPFSKEAKVWMAPTPLATRFAVRLPRAGFADFPRTELRFHDAAGKEQLEVYYLGVPDTTPEFADAARLEAYLADRIAKQR